MYDGDLSYDDHNPAVTIVQGYNYWNYNLIYN